MGGVEEDILTDRHTKKKEERKEKKNKRKQEQNEKKQSKNRLKEKVNIGTYNNSSSNNDKNTT